MRTQAEQYEIDHGHEHRGFQPLDEHDDDCCCKTCRLNRPCPCGSGKEVDEQYSYGIYAGLFCIDCCATYSDNCGHRPEGQGSQADLDECIESEDY